MLISDSFYRLPMCPVEIFEQLCNLIKSGKVEEADPFLKHFTKKYSFEIETSDEFKQRPHFLIKHIFNEALAI